MGVVLSEEGKFYSGDFVWGFNCQGVVVCFLTVFLQMLLLEKFLPKDKEFVYQLNYFYKRMKKLPKRLSQKIFKGYFWLLFQN